MFPYESRRLRCTSAAIAEHEKDFERAEDTWKVIETKAQGTITVAGIFIAFALTFAKDLPAGTHLAVRIGLTTVIVLLVTSVLAAVSVLKVRTVGSPPGGPYVEELNRDLMAAPKQKRRDYAYLLARNHATELAKVVAERETTNDSKAHLLARAQVLLSLAIGLAAILAIGIVWIQRAVPIPQ